MPKGKFVFVAVVVLGFLSRALEHPHNFTPVLAMALVAGAFAARRWVGVALPLLAMALSDLFLNNTIYSGYYEGFAGIDAILDNGATYVALAALGLLPALAPAARRQSWPTLAALGVGGTALFFFVSNFGVWLGSGMYPPNAAGLLACYVAGLPFLPATALSTLAYGAVAVATLKAARVAPTEAAALGVVH